VISIRKFITALFIVMKIGNNLNFCNSSCLNIFKS
jgi:hypothetical protein